MITERTVRILNALGLHVRPATELAAAASRFASAVTVVKDGQAVNAKSSIDLLTLAAVQGSELTVRADGADAPQAVEALVRLVESRFGEA
jgi:phosphocarrier protein